MRQLDNVTLCVIDCHNYFGAIASLMKSLKEVKPERVIFLTDIEFECLFFEVIQITKITSKRQYSEFVIRELYKYFDTSHVLITQWDSWVLDADQWDFEFLDVDYLGAPWNYPDEYCVGNGGFSLRSKRLMEAVATMPEIKITHPEDEVVARLYGQLLIDKGFSFGDKALADKFAYEMLPPNRPTFGFHQFYHESYRKPIILKRSGALGDVVLLEPVIEWFYNKRMKVYLDIPGDLMVLFRFLPYRVYHVSELNIPAEGIDFDMAYEKTPKQLVLKSYYENAGIQDGIIRNSQLNCRIAPESRLFRKYAVIHINHTDMPYRNIHGMDWDEVEHYLRELNYEVIQIGSDVVKCGTWVNTQDLQTLMYVIGGADIFIGSDSGPSHIALGCGVPSILFYGSVNPDYRIAEYKSVEVLQSACPFAGCYHSVIGVSGTPCLLNEDPPICTLYRASNVIRAINRVRSRKLQIDKQRLKITIPKISGSYELYKDIMMSLCKKTWVSMDMSCIPEISDIQAKEIFDSTGGLIWNAQKEDSMIDLGCNLAPITPLLCFTKRKYIDILPRILDHPEEQQYFEQGDILTIDIPNRYTVSIASDTIEHLTPENGKKLIERMETISDRQVLMTPLDDTFGFDFEGDDPEHHRSLWKPEDFTGYASIVFPDYHPTLNAGAFFVWKCDNIESDFDRVIYDLRIISEKW